jgi:hypothetical protein
MQADPRVDPRLLGVLVTLFAIIASVTPNTTDNQLVALLRQFLAAANYTETA